MSTGLGCGFVEGADGWYLELQNYRLEWKMYGPFATFKEADDYLRANFANPGGFTINALPGCKHDLLRDYARDLVLCDRCGWVGKRGA